MNASRIHTYIHILQTQANPAGVTHPSEPGGVLQDSQLLPQLEGNYALGSTPHSCKTKSAYTHTSPKQPCFQSQPKLRKEAGLRTDNLLTVMVLPGQEAGAALGISDGKVSPHRVGLVPGSLSPEICLLG